MERFKGKTTQMGKDGHIGIVLQASNPIKNSEDLSPVISSRINDKQK